MDKQQVIAGIRKNIVSILCGVAAVLALGFQFFWVSPRVSSSDSNAQSVKQRVQGRKAKADEINRLLTAERPNVTFTSSGADTNLGMFPTRRNIEAGKAAMDSVKSQANQVLEAALAVNRRVPLGWNDYQAADADWPLEGEAKAGERDRFKRQYLHYINADNSLFDVETGNFAQDTLQAMLGGTRPPTQKEMQAMEGSLDAMLKREVPLDDRGNPTDVEDFKKRLAEGRVALSSNMKYRRAQLHMMYVDVNGTTGASATPTGFTVHPLGGTAQPTELDCFNAQVGLWVQETVARNLQRANEEALARLPSERRNILFAPVKHLMSIALSNTPFGDARAAAPAVTEDGEPVAPPTDVGAIRGGKAPPEQPQQPAQPAQQAPPAEPPGSGISVDPTANVERQYQVSPSGRPAFSPFFDLVPFRVSLRCDAQAVPYVLEQLQASSFLTVLNVEMLAVDPATAALAGYIYGDRPVVQLNLQCEMPFMRTWLVPLMPLRLQMGLADREKPAQ